MFYIFKRPNNITPFTKYETTKLAAFGRALFTTLPLMTNAVELFIFFSNKEVFKINIIIITAMATF
jgi:hypothetical protein